MFFVINEYQGGNTDSTQFEELQAAKDFAERLTVKRPNTKVYLAEGLSKYSSVAKVEFI